MAAPTDDCRVCGALLSIKQRRTVFGDTFGVFDQLSQVLSYVAKPNDGLSRYVCAFCFNKLNKLHKVDYDLMHKLDALRSEKIAIISALKESHKNARQLQPSTPVHSHQKRLILHSPTPRKMKKALFKTPDKTSLPTHAAATPKSKSLLKIPVLHAATITQDMPRDRVKKSGVKPSFSPNKVKVMFRTKKDSKIRVKVVQDGQSKLIIKNIAMHNSKDRTARIIMDSTLKEAVNKRVLKEMKNEITKLTSTLNMSMLRRNDSKSLGTFKFANLNTEMKIWAPFFHKCISTIVKDSAIGTVVAAAISLKFHNKHMTAFQHVISQILDHSGATDETISILNKLGICVSTFAMRKTKKELVERQLVHTKALMEEEKEELEAASGMCRDELKCSEIIGDNIDITRSPSQMTKDKKRQSWHWFLLVGVQKRVLNTTLDDSSPISDIMDIENSKFVPNTKECKSLDERFIYHIMKVMVKYLDSFKKYSGCLPKWLSNPHIKETSRKSDYAILDLLDKSENKSEDMISILEHIHEKYVPHTKDENPTVIQRKVFGGDVLTNERAYSAQLAMLNSPTDYERLAGVIHRPEGLHRMMNLLLFIYQRFYKIKSATDQGTLANLRNIIGRIDIQGPDQVIEKYRAHYSFIEDTLDAYIVAACMHLLNMAELESDPTRKQVLFDALGDEQRYEFLHTIAQEILHKYIRCVDELEHIQQRSLELDRKKNVIANMYSKEEEKYICSYCSKKYKTTGHLTRHLQAIHHWVKEGADPHSSVQDCIALYRASFMKCALLLRDTNDAYKMADGDRITENAKFQLLLSHVGRHTKYQLWLFRFLAYILALLSPRMSYEYKWNCTSNLHGGIGHNIPNDNLVEIQVQKIKKKIHDQGANSTYASARRAALAAQVQHEIKENIQHECDMKVSGSKRPEVSKLNDIVAMVKELQSANVMDNINGREYNAFPRFADIYSHVRIGDLYEWISKGKERLSYEIV